MRWWPLQGALAAPERLEGPVADEFGDGVAATCGQAVAAALRIEHAGGGKDVGRYLSVPGYCHRLAEQQCSTSRKRPGKRNRGMGGFVKICTLTPFPMCGGFSGCQIDGIPDAPESAARKISEIFLGKTVSTAILGKLRTLP